MGPRQKDAREREYQDQQQLWVWIGVGYSSNLNSTNHIHHIGILHVSTLLSSNLRVSFSREGKKGEEKKPSQLFISSIGPLITSHISSVP